LLADLQRDSPSAPAIDEERAHVWRNLGRIARALEILHGQGLAHRNLDSSAILTEGGGEIDFQLTGFEWSVRLLPEQATGDLDTGAKIAHHDHVFAADWRAFGRLAGHLLALDEGRTRNPAVPAHEVAQGVGYAEIALIRALLTPPQLEASRVARSIDAIATGLELTAEGNEPRLNLFMPLGEDNPLTQAIRQASGGMISVTDIEAQRLFVEEDLERGAVARAAPNPNDEEEFGLMLRGRLLHYSGVRDYQTRHGRASDWAMAYCRAAKPSVSAGQPVFAQIPLDELRVAVITQSDPPSVRFARQKAWEQIRARLKPRATRNSGTDLAAQAFLLNQIVIGLLVLADEFPVETVAAPANFHPRQTDRRYLHLRARSDADREALSDLLQHSERLGMRLHDALLDDSEFVTDTWRLIDDAEFSDHDDDSPTEWEFYRHYVEPDGQTYVFVGDHAAPRLRRALLVSAEAAGTHKQFSRQLKAWRALVANRELLRALTYPHKTRHQETDSIVEDESFQALDSAKQDALRALLHTSPLFLVQGPPGVGKTHLVAELARQLMRADPSTRILFSAQSHAAVDHLLEGVQDAQDASAPSPLIVRCRAQDSKRRVGAFDLPEQAQRIVRNLWESPLLRHAPGRLRAQVEELAAVRRSRDDRAPSASRRFTQRPLEALIVRSANLLFGTSNTGALERLLDERAQFDWTVIEEAAKATGNELLAPLLLSRRRVMIGDHRQLPPFNAEQLCALFASPTRIRKLLQIGESIGSRSFHNPDVRGLLRAFASTGENEDDRSLGTICKMANERVFLFESLIQDSLQSAAARRRALGYAQMLTYQHRMHPAIARAFYKDELDTAERCKEKFRTEPRPIRSVDPALFPEVPIFWVDMPWVQESRPRREMERRPGPYNRDEIRAVMRAVRSIRAVAPGVDCAPTLALLTPYRAQVRELRSAIDRADPQFRAHMRKFAAVDDQYVHTVDSFQGQEADVVIVSLVRNNHRSSVRGALGFLAEDRRMNVLVSRARWCLIVIGCRRFLNDVVARHASGPEQGTVDFMRLLLEGIDQAERDGHAATVPRAPMSVVEVAFPVTRIKTRLTLYKGQPWSVVEHLILDALTQQPRTIAELEAGFSLPRAIVNESLIRLARADWVRMAPPAQNPIRFIPTAFGAAAAAAVSLPSSLRYLKRERWQLFDRIAGHVFRPGELPHIHRAELRHHPHAQSLVVLPAKLAEGVYRPEELLDAALEEDEQLLGIEPINEHATNRVALVKVVDGSVTGLPADRPFPELTAAILEAAAARPKRMTSTVRAVASSATSDRASQSKAFPVRFEPRDLLIGGSAHRDAIEEALRVARSRIIIHSTFIGEDKFRRLLPLMIEATHRGVTIDILWGQEAPRDDEATSPRAVETVRTLLKDPQIAACRERLRINTDSTRSHAKVILADPHETGRFVALVGSCNWLDSPFGSVEASVYLRDTNIVREVIRCMIGLVHTGSGIWPELASNLYMLAQAMPDDPNAKKPNARASLVIGDAHNSCVLRARDEVRHRLLVTSHRLGRHFRAGALIPLAQACVYRKVEATMVYCALRGIERAEASQFEADARKHHIDLRPIRVPRIHAKLLAWDDTAVITSQNWLSADPGPTSLARELGVSIDAPGIGGLVMDAMGEWFNTGQSAGRHRRRERRRG
jgi:hypothetical protein